MEKARLAISMCARLTPERSSRKGASAVSFASNKLADATHREPALATHWDLRSQPAAMKFEDLCDPAMGIVDASTLGPINAGRHSH